jgi:hypothetical protein
MIDLSIPELKELLAICQAWESHTGETKLRLDEGGYWEAQHASAKKMADRLHQLITKLEKVVQEYREMRDNADK